MRPTIRTCLSLVLATCFAPAAVEAQEPPASTPPPADEITLEKIMADPEWIGNAPLMPYWADDGGAVYFERERQGEDTLDLFRLDLATGEARRVEDAERGRADARGGDWSEDRTKKAYAREGDVFWKDVATGAERQLTRTAEAESAVGFLAGDRRVAYRRGNHWFARDLEGGPEVQLADLQLAKDPATLDEEEGFLETQQERLFAVVRQREKEEETARRVARERQKADPTRPPLPFYLGDEVQIADGVLSPSGEWLILALLPKEPDEGKQDKMPVFVTEHGYVDVEEVRPKVGAPKPVSPTLLLLDLVRQERHELDLGALPGIEDDPLKELRAKAEAEARKAAGDGKEKKKEAEKGAKKDDKPAPRLVVLDRIVWSDDGARAAVQLFSYDNKDRWIAGVDLEKKRLAPLHRISDPAWVNDWALDDLGWLRDGRTLWFLSEESGYAHLHLRPVPAGKARQLTRGDFELSDVVLSQDGKSFFAVANREHPGVYEVYRVGVESGALERLSALDGVTEYVLSPDERQLLLWHSTTTHPPELSVQAAASGAAPRRLTDTTSDAFEAIRWTAPEVVAVPSKHVERPIWSRVYTPAGWSADRKWPAVVFVHGAGYLQNAHKGWSSYFREFMFHSLLTRRGYVVLDMDYRASAGYGRDWRTAIYRQMGYPEVEDLEDGVAWLAANKAVDPARVGVYGGSYGGFLTFMALFRKPDLFAAGAALRPVTDWAHYNHGYTSNILNVPEVDPEAYRKSSPIEYAEGLRKPLLICHGMVDDNVVFQDTVRLVQRLIELGKTEYFETAIYPVEPHAFQEPSSWLDEYRRVYELMEENLR
ncbi:MAG TPA: prolyl oligopeptidase family serine peptidase [Thermoanaerobaculia bacterium]|nr:prolyl oligopeptidase family serine peptidase [Thermoanaerobaculia bacterium]